MKREKARGPARCSMKISLFWYQGRHSFISNLGSDIRGRQATLLASFLAWPTVLHYSDTRVDIHSFLIWDQILRAGRRPS
jgi:hypothetical protein